MTTQQEKVQAFVSGVTDALVRGWATEVGVAVDEVDLDDPALVRPSPEAARRAEWLRPLVARAADELLIGARDLLELARGLAALAQAPSSTTGVLRLSTVLVTRPLTASGRWPGARRG